MSGAGALYQQLLLEHNRSPHNTGEVLNSSHRARVHNPLCGDRVDVTLRVEQSQLLEVRCEVKGCALCRASGSLMTLALTGINCTEALSLCHQVQSAMAVPWQPPRNSDATTVFASLSSSQRASLPGDLAVFLPVRSAASRIGCITLSWQAIEQALQREPKQ